MYVAKVKRICELTITFDSGVITVDGVLLLRYYSEEVPLF